MTPELKAKIAKHKERKEMVESVDDAISALIRIVNGNDEDLAQLIVNSLETRHRTLQQGLLRNIQKAIVIYGETARTDARNDGAKEWCKEVSKIEHRMPFI